MERRQVTAAGKAPPRQQLPPGFRFHPTDEELVVQYLRRKALARPLPAAVIPVVHVAALPDPWDLPGASEGEAAYFFNLRQAPPRRRRTASGYWKATGKEKPVFVQLQGPSGSGSGKRLLVGVKTALAFHRGKGKASLTRTDWVMHEYRLAAAPGDSQQSCEWVVCRVSLKNNRARRPPAQSSRHACSYFGSSDAADIGGNFVRLKCEPRTAGAGAALLGVVFHSVADPAATLVVSKVYHGCCTSSTGMFVATGNMKRRTYLGRRFPISASAAAGTRSGSTKCTRENVWALTYGPCV